MLRRPVYDKPEDLIFNLSDTAWDAITSLIAPLETRIATLDGLKNHPFLSDVPWDNLRETPAPFVPALDSEEDAGYFDAFDDPEDMGGLDPFFYALLTTATSEIRRSQRKATQNRSNARQEQQSRKGPLCG